MTVTTAPGFRALPRGARLYVPTVMLAAAAALVADQLLLAQGPKLDPVLLGVLVVLCSAASLYEVLGPGHYSFQPNFAFFFWGALLLPPWAIGVLAVACFLPSWAARRAPWYMMAFNVANYALAGAAAHQIRNIAEGFPPEPAGLASAGGLLIAGLLFVGINHVLIAFAASLSRRLPLAGTLADIAHGTALDVALAATGATLAIVWSVDPFLLLLGAGPMALVYRALWVPMLRHKSRTDPKTGLSNSEHFTQQCTEALRTARKRGTDLSLVMIDLDHLRMVNNQHGHLAGDRLLKEVADVVAEMTGTRGMASRFGGDEMCVLLPDRSVGSAQQLAEAVRARVESMTIPIDGSEGGIATTVSIGVAAFPEHGDSVNALLNASDAAVYDAKLGGRNRVRIALPPGTRETLDRVAPPESVELRHNGGPDPIIDDSGGNGVPREPRADHPEEPEARAELPLPAADAEEPRSADTEPRNPRFIWAYAGTLCVTAAVVAALSSPAAIVDDPLVFGLLIVSVLALDIVRIDVFERATISPSAVPTLALAFLFGPLGPLAAEAVAALVNVVRRKEGVKTAFDLGSLALSGSAAAIVFHALPTESDALLLLAGALAGGAYYAVNMPLLAVVMGLAEGRGPLEPFRERLAWLWPHYVAFGLLAAAFIVSEHALDLYAFLVFALPILMLWVGEKQYLDRSRSSVTELRRSYEELELANKRLRGLLEDNQELLGRMHRSYLSTITSLARTIEAKDPYTGGHTERVAQLARVLAQQLGFSEAELQAVNVGALIHDIGKIGVSDRVLLKEGRLSEEEFAEIQRHPEISSYIVADLELPAIVKQMVRSHHERFDGSGYPDGLTGEEIPLAARILAVADALDAMTSDRPYRDALPVEVARAEIESMAGTQFCPTVVSALATCLERDPKLVEQFSTTLFPPSEPTPAG